MITKDDLKEYGKVELCEEVDGEFHIKITDGFSINANNTFGLMKIIDDAVGEKYPLIKKCVSDVNLFHYVLKQRP